jgi:hypothetical protein
MLDPEVSVCYYFMGLINQIFLVIYLNILGGDSVDAGPSSISYKSSKPNRIKMSVMRYCFLFSV